MVLFQDVLLFAYGLVPQYVGVAIVEKYYTAKWTAFWNVFGLSVIALDFAMGSADVRSSVGFALIGIAALSLLYFSLGSQGYYYLSRWSQKVRTKIGMSASSIIISWALIGLYIGGFDLGEALGFTALGVISVFSLIFIARG
jgi:hypothetical protein